MAKKKILTIEKTEKSTMLSAMVDAELVTLRAKLEVEMRRRNLGFSVGAIGETLVISHYTNTPGLPTLQPAPTGTKNVDALSRDGERYSIKSTWKAKKTGTIYPDPENRDKRLFEHIVIAILNDEFALKAIYEFTWDEFTIIRSWDSRMSAWYISCSNKTLKKATQLL
jgi:hypothetical protein